MLSGILILVAFAIPTVLLCVGVYVLIRDGVKSILNADTKMSVFKFMFVLLMGCVLLGLIILDFFEQLKSSII
jgi:hypothetical protein